MKLDFKSWLLIILSILFIIFFSLWYFKGNSSVKDDIKNAKEQIANIQKERNQITEKDDSLKLAYKNLQFSYNQQDSVIKGLNQRVLNNESIIEESQSKLDNYDFLLRKNQATIDSLEKNPTKSTGENLLNSLQNKTK